MEIFQFYGIDWVATACGLTGVYLLGNQNKWGFVVFMLASVSWVMFGTITGSIPVIIGSTIFFFMHARGLYKWIKKEEQNAQEVV